MSLGKYNQIAEQYCTLIENQELTGFKSLVVELKEVSLIASRHFYHTLTFLTFYTAYYSSPPNIVPPYEAPRREAS